MVAASLLIALRLLVKPALASVDSLLARAALRKPAVASLAPTQVRNALRAEPPHTVAAVIAALPTATAAAVLELYSAEERVAIVQRLNRVARAGPRTGWDGLLSRG